MSLNHMDAGVLPMVKHDQVRKSIVSRIPVDVVDVLSSNGVKAEELFSNGDVVLTDFPSLTVAGRRPPSGPPLDKPPHRYEQNLAVLSLAGVTLKFFPHCAQVISGQGSLLAFLIRSASFMAAPVLAPKNYSGKCGCKICAS